MCMCVCVHVCVCVYACTCMSECMWQVTAQRVSRGWGRSIMATSLGLVTVPPSGHHGGHGAVLRVRCPARLRGGAGMGVGTAPGRVSQAPSVSSMYFSGPFLQVQVAVLGIPRGGGARAVGASPPGLGASGRLPLGELRAHQVAGVCRPVAVTGLRGWL